MTDALESLLTDLRLTHSPVSLDTRFAPHALVQRLTEQLGEVKWSPGDEMFRALRQVKTEAEMGLLERAARQSDRAIISALNHMEGTIDVLSYAVTEFTERLRVHVGEFGGSGAGHIATMQGSDARVYYLPPHGSFQPGNLTRIELTNHHRGYWADATRTVVIGEPTEAQERAYQDNIRLKEAALQVLQPGTRCAEVFDAAVTFAQREGIEFWQAAGIGHGVGTSEREAPYLTPDDVTPLEPGMVLVLAVYTYGPDRELICSQDTYAVVEDGHRLLSWYKNWDALYRVLGRSARHG
jgi:Xaa-Pro aminopeptidase